MKIFESFVILVNLGAFVGANKIVGGFVAEQNSIPYQVAVFLKIKPKGVLLCGGSILNRKTILTAAHCLIKSDMALIIFGAHDLTSNDIEVNILQNKPVYANEKANKLFLNKNRSKW